MQQLLKATYHSGVFIPKERCEFPEDSEVELFVQSPTVIFPAILSEEQKFQITKNVIERIRKNPLPSSILHLSREELHERN